MKNIYIIFLIFCSISLANELENFQKEHHQINKTGMLVLGSWAVGNIAVGTIGRSTSKGNTKYFHEMNAAWNLINLGIAGFGFFNLLEPDINLNLAEALSQQKSMEGILLFNAGLDLGYIAIGAYLKERSKNSEKNKDRLLGYGNSLILQGAFLLLFDISLYYFHYDLSNTFLNSIESVEFGLNSIRIRF